jgi:FtsZ-interacting cell division protein ZipA
MDTTTIVIVVLVALLVIAAVGYFMTKNRRSSELRDRYGSEYDRAVESSGGRGAAEKELRERQERVQKLHIRNLTQDEQLRYSEQWRVVQAHFVDDPANAINEADDLVQQVMNTAGYPITDFEQQAADISVDHPDVVKNYRAGHAIADAHEHEPQDTESLRQAMLHYRALFADLLGTGAPVR